MAVVLGVAPALVVFGALKNATATLEREQTTLRERVDSISVDVAFIRGRLTPREEKP